MNIGEQRHIILRQIIELNVPMGINAFKLQNSASECFYVSALNSIDSVFNKINPGGQNILIDKLEIDLGNFREEEILNKTWLEKFAEKLEKVINKQSVQLNSKTSSTLGIFEQWVFYIQHGYLPWNSSGNFSGDYLNILNLVRTRKDLASRLGRLILENSTFCDRLVLQHDYSFVISVMSIFSGASEKIVKTTINEILKLAKIFSKSPKKTVNDLKYEILPELLKLSFKYSDSNFTELQIRSWIIQNINPIQIEEFLKSKSNRQSGHEIKTATLEILKKISNEEFLTGNIAENGTDFNGNNITVQADENTDLDSHLQSESIFVKYAGLILLHPFLKPFFKNLELILENDFVDEDSKIKAIGLLHFLATGKTFAEEHELVIAKILCNYPIERVVGRTFKLSKLEKKEANTLLEELIGHWSVLKNTSKEGLQESFLCRNGMIIEKDGNIYLKMETSAIDILLEYYPANIGVVKLPWRKEMLFVEWR